MNELKSIQRIFKLSAVYEATAALLSDEIHSAQDIIERGEEEFISSFSKELGGAESAKALYLLAHRFLHPEHATKE